MRNDIMKKCRTIDTCSLAPMSDNVGPEVTRQSRTIILCFDGTASEYGGTVSRFLVISLCCPVTNVYTPFVAEHQRRQVLFLIEERRLRRTALLLPSPPFFDLSLFQPSHAQ